MALLPRERGKSVEAGTGIEPVNSGFADRGLTTWLPRRINLPDLIRWLFSVLASVSRCQFSNTTRMSTSVTPANAHSPVQWKQGVQVLSGWLKSQWQAKATLLLRTRLPPTGNAGNLPGGREKCPNPELQAPNSKPRTTKGELTAPPQGNAATLPEKLCRMPC